MSKFHARAAFFKGTTLTDKGDYDARAAINTGTRSSQAPITMQGGGQPYLQPGAGDNTSQTAQAYNSFMGMRKTQLVMEHERGHAEENRAGRQQAKLRLKESY